MKVENLRKKYPKFIYQKYFYKISKNNLKIFFKFKIEPDIYFKPEITIKNIKQYQVNLIKKARLDNLIFHLGLIEIPSYWKTTCSPKIEIQAGFLNKEQEQWWKTLFIKSLGQFFYQNKINFRQRNFLKIKIKPANSVKKTLIKIKDKKNKFLVPIGGGKDSIVTLELLNSQKKIVNTFLVNPTKIQKGILKVANIKNPIIAERKIDPKLLKLNQEGFLNGHTPITAVYSFLAVLAAVLFNYKNIAFSNEKSADEGNLKYLENEINHQWSKSSEFEKMFQYYCQKYLVKGINYFSFLRKYTELEITKMFTNYPQYFSVFSSCNVVRAKKLKKRWCGNCPKCLFLYLVLYPFLEKKELLKIFGKDFFNPSTSSRRKKILIMDSLLSQKKQKPFECVGTREETKLALKLSLAKAKKEGKVPYLLKPYTKIIFKNRVKKQS